MKKIISLFFIFAKIGAVTFGGGYAILPFLRREFIEKRDWVTDDELMDYFAVSQCTPGVIAVNSATFIGRKQAGALGAIASTLGVVFPSVVIITVIAFFLKNFAELSFVKAAFSGIRAAVCALIVTVVINLFKKSVKDKLTLFIAILVFVCMCVFELSPIVFVVLAAICGILVKRSEKSK